MMEQYKNLGQGSDIDAYEIGDGSISIRRGDGWTYLYTNLSAGPEHIAKMQELAVSGKGLYRYMTKWARGMYAARNRF